MGRAPRTLAFILSVVGMLICLVAILEMTYRPTPPAQYAFALLKLILCLAVGMCAWRRVDETAQDTAINWLSAGFLGLIALPFLLTHALLRLDKKTGQSRPGRL